MKINNIFLLVGLFILVSCSPEQKKERNISKLEDVVEDVELHSQNYNQEEWSKKELEFDRIIQELENQPNLTDDDLYRIGRLKARYLKAVARQTIEETTSQLSNLIKEAAGFLDEINSKN